MDAHVSCVSIILNELGEQVSSTLHLGECTLPQFSSVCERDRWACQVGVVCTVNAQTVPITNSVLTNLYLNYIMHTATRSHLKGVIFKNHK